MTTTDLNTKISEVENKIPDHASKLKQANLVSKADVDIKLISFIRKIT